MFGKYHLVRRHCIRHLETTRHFRRQQSESTLIAFILTLPHNEQIYLSKAVDNTKTPRGPRVSTACAVPLS